MSIAVTVQEAQTKLHELINLVESGEEVFITKSPSIKFKLTLQNHALKNDSLGSI
jgi:antitoxin (DNA-binding transcriptional repressor) of toxin-antitoxin stability system